MFGLRQKLLFGFGGLLAMLLLVSALGIAVLARYRGAMDQFYYENWRSVEYGQNMVDALDRLDEIGRRIRFAETLPGDQEEAKKVIAAFDLNCQNEDHNITLPGESEIAAALTAAWNGNDLDGKIISHESYRAAYLKLLDPSISQADRASLYVSADRLRPVVKAQAQAVIRLNVENMRPIGGRAKTMADNAIRLMVLLAIAGAALAVAFTAVMSRSILRPLRTLTRSFREIEQGNLDLVVQVKSQAMNYDSWPRRLIQWRPSCANSAGPIAPN